MSSDENPPEGAQVIDEENRIDNRLKDRVLDARDRVATNENEVFVKAPLSSDITRTRAELVEIWGTSVTQYLKTIEPLLRSEELSRAEYFYTELPIIDKRVIPPDGPTVVSEGNDRYEKQINWSRLYGSEIDNWEIIRDTPLFGPGFEPPEPKPVELYGLKSIIETGGISESWRVPLNPGSAFGKQTRVAHPVYKEPLSKSTLEYAVRKADQFLQEAGIGLEVGDPKSEADADYSDIEEIDSLDSQ
jgi:hypothetical protein